MVKELFLIAVIFPYVAQSQVEIAPELLETAKMLSLANSAPEEADLFNDKILAQEKDCSSETKTVLDDSPAITFKDSEKKKWKFSIRTTMTGPKELMNKEFIELQESTASRSLIDKLIQTEFESYKDRMKAVSDTCQGLSDKEKISLTSQLARRLSSIYDFGRANNGINSGRQVTSEEQWQALKSGAPAGVCRDASLTLSQFLLACGYPKDQVAIKSYRTAGSGHQVTSVLTPDGEYTFNWSELYAMDGADFNTPDPNIANAAMTYILFDPETGKIIDQRRTELGDALKYLSGGTPRNLDYTPNMLVAEAAYGGVAAKVFMTETERGEKAQGGALSLEEIKGNDRSFIYLSTGVAYAKNRREVSLNPNRSLELGQDILYFQSEAKVQKAIPIFFTDNGKFSVAPSLSGSLDLIGAKTSLTRENLFNADMMNEVAAGATVFYDGDPVRAYIKAEAVSALTHKLYNNEQAEDEESGIYLNRYQFHGGASWENNRLILNGNTSIMVTRLEKQGTISVGLEDKELSFSCQAIYSLYDRNYGSREDYLVSKCSKNFSVQKLGTVSLGAESRISLDQSKDRTIGITATLELR